MLLAVVCFANIGCLESSFKLANDSRLPNFVTLPPGLTHADVSLTMNYYIGPKDRTAQFILRDKNKKIIEKKKGILKCGHPFELENPPRGYPSGNPGYEAITVNGITEIIEHRRMEPIFYISDDPVIRKLIESASCSPRREVQLKN